jgi:phosphate transport system protein
MRETFHEELDRLIDQLVEMIRLVDTAMSRATTALLDADLALAEGVIAADKAVDALRKDLDGQALELVARQQPVATDLRTIIASLRMGADLERMGDLARHIAELARRRYPRSPVPPELRSTVVQMGQVAQRIVAKAGGVVASGDAQAALELEEDDDEMDLLQQTLYERLLNRSWTDGIEAAVDLTLAGRYYERFADHAVSVARRVAFVAGKDSLD